MSVATTESSMTLSQSMDSVNTVAEEEVNAVSFFTLFVFSGSLCLRES